MGLSSWEEILFVFVLPFVDVRVFYDFLGYPRESEIRVDGSKASQLPFIFATQHTTYILVPISLRYFK